MPCEYLEINGKTHFHAFSVIISSQMNKQVPHIIFFPVHLLEGFYLFFDKMDHNHPP